MWWAASLISTLFMKEKGPTLWRQHTGGAEVQLHSLALPKVGGEWSSSRPGTLYPVERTQVTAEQQAGWAPETVWVIWKGEISVGSARIRTSYRPARNLVTIPTTLSSFLRSLSQANWKLSQNSDMYNRSLITLCSFKVSQSMFRDDASSGSRLQK
jgi:hypothetical protein